MAEEGFIEEFDPYKDTLNDVIRKYYKRSTKLTRFTSERGADFDLGNMTIADAMMADEDTSKEYITNYFLLHLQKNYNNGVQKNRKPLKQLQEKEESTDNTKTEDGAYIPQAYQKGSL